MKIIKAVRQAFALLILVFLGSCGPVSGNIPAQIVAPLNDAMSEFGLKVVELPRLLDVSQLKGQRFIFTAGMNIPGSIYSEVYDRESSFESARSSLFSKVPLYSVNLNLVWNGSFYKAADFDSLYMLTAYHLFEEINDFFTAVVGDRSPATMTSALVNVYGSFTSRGLIKVPTGFVDNSAYLPLEDMFKMYRVADQDGLPYQMNPGVVAHEFQHRVFHEHVFRAKGKEGFLIWKNFSSAEASLKYARIRLLLRATDEGLSDINAVGFSRNTAFLSVSKVAGGVDAKTTDDQRDIEGSFAQVATYDNLADSSLEAKFVKLCHGESLNYTNPNWRYYCLGTVIARTLWDAADRDISILRKDILPAVNQSLPSLSNALIMQFDKYDVDVFWRALLEKLELPRAKILCREIEHRFLSLYTKERMSRCF